MGKFLRLESLGKARRIVGVLCAVATLAALAACPSDPVEQLRKNREAADRAQKAPKIVVAAGLDEQIAWRFSVSRAGSTYCMFLEIPAEGERSSMCGPLVLPVVADRASKTRRIDNTHFDDPVHFVFGMADNRAAKFVIEFPGMPRIEAQARPAVGVRFFVVHIPRKAPAGKVSALDAKGKVVGTLPIQERPSSGDP